MPSMIERIAEAEAKAAQIKKQAAADCRERTAGAVEEASRTVETAREAARIRTAEAAQKAEEEGKALAADIFAQNAQEADAALSRAELKLEQAISYILEKAAEA